MLQSHLQFEFGFSDYQCNNRHRTIVPVCSESCCHFVGFQNNCMDIGQIEKNMQNIKEHSEIHLLHKFTEMYALAME